VQNVANNDITETKVYKATYSGSADELWNALEEGPASRELLSACLFHVVVDLHLDKLIALLKHGASVHEIDDGQTPLHRVRELGARLCEKAARTRLRATHQREIASRASAAETAGGRGPRNRTGPGGQDCRPWSRPAVPPPRGVWIQGCRPSRNDELCRRDGVFLLQCVAGSRPPVVSIFSRSKLEVRHWRCACGSEVVKAFSSTRSATRNVTLATGLEHSCRSHAWSTFTRLRMRVGWIHAPTVTIRCSFGSMRIGGK